MVIEPRIGFLLPGDHPEQRRLAGAVRADDADNAAGRQLERQIVDQQPVAIAFRDAFRINHLVAQPLAGRNHDLRLAGTPVAGGFHQFVIGPDTRLRLGLPCLWDDAIHSCSRASDF
jgi:hypothetical protein